jgi:rhamnosyltransferase subunit B
MQAPLQRLVRAQVRRMEGPLHVLRAELKLPPVRYSLLMGGLFSPLGTLALFDPVMASPQRDWPPRTLVSGAALYDAAAAELDTQELQGRLESFLSSGPPPLVFALGSSAVWLAQDFWKHAIAACQKLGHRGLLLTGMPLEQPLPATVAAFPYLPYSYVFPRSTAVIHQAGIGTLSQALRSARPQLLIPAGFDQPDNAARAARLGIGRILPFHRAHDEARLVRELRALLADPAHERLALETAHRLRGIDGAAVAAQRIISL